VSMALMHNAHGLRGMEAQVPQPEHVLALEAPRLPSLEDLPAVVVALIVASSCPASGRISDNLRRA
jgi:hypothetical protein